MAKKKTKKEETEKASLFTEQDRALLVSVVQRVNTLDGLGNKLQSLNQRIDRIVFAHENCKKLKGL